MNEREFDTMLLGAKSRLIARDVNKLANRLLDQACSAVLLASYKAHREVFPWHPLSPIYDRFPLEIRVDLERATSHIIAGNYLRDQSYRPYCGRCSQPRRMRLEEPFYWSCECGAVHDERRVML